MKVSEAIDQLQRLKNRHGDLDCTIGFRAYHFSGEGDVHEICLTEHKVYVGDEEETLEKYNTISFVCDYISNDDE